MLQRTVPIEDAGLRLDQVLANLVPSLSRARLRSWIESGRVTVDGLAGVAKRRVRGGEILAIVVTPEPVAGSARAQAIPLAMIYEDAAILVVDKPAGMVVHPGNGNHDGTLQNALLAYDPSLAPVPRAGIVHRLDKDTSGLLVVARGLAAHAALVRQLADRSVRREYVAVARGDIVRSVVIDAPIGRHPIRRTTMAVVERGRPARTHVDVVERFGDATLIRCRLETGRTHQIRVHLSEAGHPLVGDPVYGGRRKDALASMLSRQALHACHLELDHPESGKRVRFDSPLPADLVALIEAMRARVGGDRMPLPAEREA